MYGLRSWRQYSMARWMACQLATGSLPSTTSPGMPNALPRSMICRSPCWLHAGVEMPQPLFMTTIRTGSSFPGRVDHTRHEAKSPSAVPVFDLKPQAGVERLLAGAADPEVALAGFAHLDHPLFHGRAADHEAVDLQAALSGQRLAPADDLRGKQCGLLAPAWSVVARHAYPPRDTFRSPHGVPAARGRGYGSPAQTVRARGGA